MARLVIRRTFLDIEFDEQSPAGRSCRRLKRALSDAAIDYGASTQEVCRSFGKEEKEEEEEAGSVLSTAGSLGFEATSSTASCADSQHGDVAQLDGLSDMEDSVGRPLEGEGPPEASLAPTLVEPGFVADPQSAFQQGTAPMYFFRAVCAPAAFDNFATWGDATEQNLPPQSFAETELNIAAAQRRAFARSQVESLQPACAQQAEFACSDASTKEAGQRTTVIVRNLPHGYSRGMLLDLLDTEGFEGRYDFVYLPADFERWVPLGYAIVNFHTNEEAEYAREHFHGFRDWKMVSQNVCESVWAEPLQGLAQHCERYRNSPVMHDSVPDEFKPAVFVHGRRAAFPTPTKRIQRPKRAMKQSVTHGCRRGSD